MKYTLDLSGYNHDGKAGIDRLGGLFMSIEDAVAHGKKALKMGRFPFAPKVLWVKNEEGEVVVKEQI